MRFDFTRPGGQWPKELVPGAGDWQRFDDKQSRTVNGVTGGVWAPAAPIIVGGGGVQSDTGSPPAIMRAAGGVYTASGGRIVIDQAAADFPQFSTSRSRKIRIPILNFTEDRLASPAGPITVLNDQTGWGIIGTGAGAGEVFFPIPGRFLHIGARLASVGIEFRITQKPTAVPAAGPFLQFYSTDDSGSTPLFAPSGQVNPYYWSLVGWTNTGSPTLGQYVIAGSLGTNAGWYWKVTTAGTFSGAEPLWPAGPVGTVITSGSVTLTCAGQVGIYPLAGATPDSYYNSGEAQVVELTTDGTSGLSGTTNIIAVNRRYELGVAGWDTTNAMIMTGAFLTFDTIADMRFP